MIQHSEISDRDLRSKIKNQEISFGGNITQRIYGTLSCASGKRLRRENRIFFETEQEAIERGFRPCGNCLQPLYQNWKNETI